MRLGGFFKARYDTPAEWVAILQSKGYTAAYSPFRIAPGGALPEDGEVEAYRLAAEAADIVIAEVGAWGRNCLAEDEAERDRAVRESIALLTMAEKLGARCLVNSAGWRQNPADSFSTQTFDLIVQTVRTLVDAVKPDRTAFTLELVPDVFPYSVESYLDLLGAVDRTGFAVHLDPVNIVDNAFKYYRNADLIRHACQTLGPHIRSCHAKDVTLVRGMVVHISETRPGLGNLDYRTFIREIDRLNPDMPLMMEHLDTDEDYALAATYIRTCAKG